MSFRIFWGFVFLILGVSLIARNFGIPILSEIWKLWPLIFVYLGYIILSRTSKKNNYFRRFKKMREERFKILKLIEEGKVKAEEAEELLKKLEETQEKEKRFLKVNVIENGKTKVNVTIPISLIRWGLKFASKYSSGEYGEKIEITPEEIESLINDPDFRGRIVDINEENEQVIVEIV
ncbi:MAG: LiaF transmembrane domain-containing protein [Dictyoglomaceae bacterium]